MVQNDGQGAKLSLVVLRVEEDGIGFVILEL